MATRMGGKERLTVHLAGNRDLLDVLASKADGGTVLTDGLAEQVAGRFEGAFTLEVSSSSRSSHREFLASLDAEHPAVASRPDVVVLSLDPDVFTDDESETPTFFENMRGAIRLLKDNGAHVLFVNASTLDPTEEVSNYARRDEPFTRKAQRLDLALLELSIEEGISIIDVDRLFAELGGAEIVEGPLRYTEAGCRAVCDETLRVLEDYGFFEVRPLVEQVGRATS